LVASIGDRAVIKILCIFVGLFALALIDVNGSKHTDPSRASAAAPLCTVDMDRFLNMKEGMSRSQIERDIGCPGELLSSRSIGKIQTVLLSWNGNSPSSKLRAAFRNDTLIGKAQFGLK
jgi:hypothetical protein